MTELARPLPRTVLHIGAKLGDRLERLRAGGALRILLIEPDPGLAASLSRCAEGMEGVTVLSAGVAAHAGRGELEVMNLPGLNSLRPPTDALRSLFPGLRVVVRQEVPLIEPAEVVRELGEISRPFWLIVDMPGMEKDILTGLQAAGALDLVDHLELRCGEGIFHEGGASRLELEQWLLAQYFALERVDGGDPEWPVLHWRADIKARALSEAEARIARLEGQLAKAAMALSEGTDRNAALQEAVEARAAELAETNVRLKSATGRITELERTVLQLRDGKAGVEDELQRALLDLRRAQQDLGIALRHQDRLQADLADLQERFKEERDARQDQADLLSQLTPRLREAARQLQGFSLADSGATPALPARRTTANRKTKQV